MNTMLMNDAAVFLADFGEDIVYYPRSGSPRSIKAIVDRNIPIQIGENLSVAMMITVANSTTTGIATSEVDGRGADQVSVAPRLGTTAKRFGLYFVGEGLQGAQDPGMVQYELR